MSNAAQIGDRIRSKRLELHMTQGEVAKKMGVAKPTVNRYERGVIADIPTKQIAKLAEALATTPEYLLGWSENHPEEYEKADDFDPFIRNLTYRWEKLSEERKADFKKLVAYMYPELVVEEAGQME